MLICSIFLSFSSIFVKYMQFILNQSGIAIDIFLYDFNCFDVLPSHTELWWLQKGYQTTFMILCVPKYFKLEYHRYLIKYVQSIMNQYGITIEILSLWF